MLALKSVIVMWKNWKCDLFFSRRGKVLCVEEYCHSKPLAHMSAGAFIECFACPTLSIFPNRFDVISQ